MESQKEAILMTLLGVAKLHHKPYCFVSQSKQLELIKKYHSWNISRRTLNRRLKELESEGYFIRVRRHIKDKDGLITFRSTLYKFCGKLFNWLYGLKRWISSLYSVYRVPNWSQHQLKKQPVFTITDPAIVEILSKTNIKGMAPP